MLQLWRSIVVVLVFALMAMPVLAHGPAKSGHNVSASFGRLVMRADCHDQASRADSQRRVAEPTVSSTNTESGCAHGCPCLSGLCGSTASLGRTDIVAAAYFPRFSGTAFTATPVKMAYAITDRIKRPPRL